MVFYLKINRTERWAMKCLQHWVKSIEALSGSHKIFLLCDKTGAKDLIMENICFSKENYDFLESNRTDEELTYIVSHVADKYWTNAAYAHLTTFLHAREHGFERFWNIDADDTYVYLMPERVGELLQKAEDYAVEQGVHIFSLDMWTTRTSGSHWSFGVTYTDNTVDWMAMLRDHCTDSFYQDHLHSLQNVDEYLTYLKFTSELRIETFYAENLRFVHYSDDLFAYPWGSGFYHWSGGVIHQPILSHCFGLSREVELAIGDDVVCFDMEITDEESTGQLCAASQQTKYIQYMVSSNQLEKKINDLPIGARLIVYGGKQHGYIMAKKLQNMGKSWKILCLADRNYEWLSFYVKEFPVYSIENAHKQYAGEYDYIIINSINAKTCWEMYQIMLDLGVDRKRIITLYAPEA